MWMRTPPAMAKPLFTLLFAGGIAYGPAQTLPGTLKYSWIGNTFQGAGINGYSEWAPMLISKMKVAPDGKVLLGGHSEGGNELSIWAANGRIEDSTIPKVADTDPGRGCWGWGTINSACAFDTGYIYATTLCGEMIRFRRKPPYAFVNSWPLTDSLIYGFTLDADNFYLGTGYGRFLVRKKSDFSVVRDVNIPGSIQDMVLDKQGSLWMIVDSLVEKFGKDGAYQGITIHGLVSPVSLAIDNTGKLMVADNGPNQQVYYYDVTGTPTLAKTFGAKGGIYTGTLGEMGPQRLFNLKGAATDSLGNIYVAMSRDEGMLRKFSPDGALLWENYSSFYVDNVSVDPASDGKLIYGSDEVFTMDYTRGAGKEWTLKALTYDPVGYPADDRATNANKPQFGWVRTLAGKKYQFTQTMYGGDIQIYYFAEGYVSHRVKTVKSGGWANWVDSQGNIWTNGNGDSLVMHRFTGLDANGVPQYALKDKAYPTPPQFTAGAVQRIRFYTPEETGIDGGVMYLAGYTPEKPQVDWGCVGSRIARYDGWQGGNTSMAKASFDVPVDDEGHYAKEMDVAGDYIFFVTTRPARGHDQAVFAYANATGALVGNMFPQTNSGWTDMLNAISTFKRSNGEYIVTVEEDFRGKVNLYRWCPSGNCVESAAVRRGHGSAKGLGPAITLGNSTLAIHGMGGFHGIIQVLDVQGRVMGEGFANGQEETRIPLRPRAPSLVIMKLGERFFKAIR